MSFVSVPFAAFLAALVVAYYLVPKRLQWPLLLAASYVFYLAGGIKTVVYLLFTTASVFAAGLWLDKLNGRKKAIDKRDAAALAKNKTGKKLVLGGVLALNFGMLFLLKYLDYSLEVLSDLLGRFGVVFQPQVPDLLMPLGVSFFIFQSAGYAIDVYRGKYPAQRNLFRFALFTSFFPQMVQGPISRYNELADQLYAQRDFEAENIRDGILRMLWGYFKKMVIADRASAIVSAFFGNWQDYGGAVTAFSVLLYCFNLYCDFSGGIDITIGAAQLFGIRLTENFARPIFATSLAEYWRRWHITLGTWMRDYVFYSLSLSKPFAAIGRWSRKHVKGKAGKMVPTTLATLVVYLIIGVWHGSSFKYIFYGLWNGAIITSATLLAATFTRWKKSLRINDDALYWQVFGILRTSFIVFLGRYITRAPDLATAFRLMARTVTPGNIGIRQLLDGTLLRMGLDLSDYIIMAAGLAVLLAVEYTQEKKGSVRAILAKKSGPVQLLVVTLLLAAVVFLHVNQLNVDFIYKQF